MFDGLPALDQRNDLAVPRAFSPRTQINGSAAAEFLSSLSSGDDIPRGLHVLVHGLVKVTQDHYGIDRTRSLSLRRKWGANSCNR
jgi:hypothetical protein